MKRAVYGVVLGLVLSPLAASVGQEAAKPDDAIAAKAVELTKALTTRVEKIAALYKFTRDEIRQVQTCYS